MWMASLELGNRFQQRLRLGHRRGATSRSRQAALTRAIPSLSPSGLGCSADEGPMLRMTTRLSPAAGELGGD
jgi:hypothetical protein